EEDPILVLAVDGGAEVREIRVRLGEVLAVGALALEEVWDGVEAEAVHSEVEPETAHVLELFADLGVVVVEVRLMAEESVPVIPAGSLVPRPARRPGLFQDDARHSTSVLGF